MQGDLTALIERVEKATGPDSALDVAIACTLLDARQHKAWNAANGFRPRGAPPLPDVVFWMRHARPYTSSLDAALALVEEILPGKYWYVCAGRARVGEPLYGAQIVDKDANGVSHDEPMGIAEHDHSAPLALILALLRALQSQQKNSEVKDAG